MTVEIATEAISDAAITETAGQIDTTLPTEVSEPVLQAEPETPVASAETVATPDAQGADVAPAAAEPAKKTSRVKKAPRVKAQAAKTDGAPREGSKTAQVAAMMKRPDGATISAIMATMCWQKHIVRGFVAGAMKKAGFTVESVKPEGGERTYLTNS